MDNLTFLAVALSFLWASIYVLSTNLVGWKSGGTARLPPGPHPFPVIGNILALGKMPHESLCKLSKIYGPLMSLKLGSITTIVVSSPDIAKEVLQKHDQVFSGRTVPSSAKVLGHHEASVVWLPAAGPWRSFRKICKEHMFSMQSINAGQDLRQKKVMELVEFVQQSCKTGVAVNIGQAAFTTVLNLISNTFFSFDLAHYNSVSSQEFKDLVWTIMEIAGRPNSADYFPVLKWIDPQGISRDVNHYFPKIFKIFDGIIHQRLRARASAASTPANGDLLEVLLNLNKENDSQWSSNNINHFLLDIFIAGTDTTSSTVEWAMAELLKNPEKLGKVQAEVRKVIGREGLVMESDISRLPYLQALVKETLRLHPPAPFLIPHKAEAAVELAGFSVPKNAQVLVNVWGIGRDPKMWPEPNSFVPERFLARGTDLTGQDFELIPFGAGRRICPGFPLAYRMVHLILGSLLYSFDWKLEEGMKPEDIDMSEKFGLTLQKAIPLKTIPAEV